MIEVAITSLALDRAKEAVYATANIPEFWIIRPTKKRTEVYRDPCGLSPSNPLAKPRPNPSPPPMSKRDVSWREETEDGEIQFVRAIREGKAFRIETKVKGEEEWTPHKRPSRAHLEYLLEYVDLRYRRRKGSLKEVECVRKMISNLG